MELTGGNEKVEEGAENERNENNEGPGEPLVTGTGLLETGGNENLAFDDRGAGKEKTAVVEDDGEGKEKPELVAIAGAVVEGKLKTEVELALACCSIDFSSLLLVFMSWL